MPTDVFGVPTLLASFFRNDKAEVVVVDYIKRVKHRIVVHSAYCVKLVEVAYFFVKVTTNQHGKVEERS